MKPAVRHLLAVAVIATCGMAGWWLARDMQRTATSRVTLISAEKNFRRHGAAPVVRSRSSVRDAFQDGSTVEIFGSREPGESILRFPSDDAYDAFLFAVATSSIRVVDQLDRLRAVRLGYGDREDLALLLMGENITTYAAIPTVPTPGPAAGRGQKGRVGFGNGLLAWLGVKGDNSTWGAGVKVAVLDSGVVPHLGLPGFSKSIAIVPFSDDVVGTNGHGTAVASLIVGTDDFALGVAPAAELISIRISDDDGQADSFAMAAGILAAVDEDVDLINISMGTPVDNPLIAEAVAYANDHQVLIVASSGNSEGADATYPAAYPSVISVGAVDARGEHLEFSNYGKYLSLTAPGYAVNAAWPGNRHTRLSGTSASAPIVTGAIAATMSNRGGGKEMTSRQAAEIVMNNADEAGIPGPDSEYGVGILNLGRIMNRAIPGIVDAAITDQRLVQNGKRQEIQVTLQNRGTTVLVNTLLEVSSPAGVRQFNTTTLAPGEIQVHTVTIRAKDGPVEVSSRLILGNPGRDATPYNNRRSDTLY